MSDFLHDVEPFYGWLNLYNHEEDELSPFHEVQHNAFHYDRSINNIPAHPLWDEIGSESLLVKILYANYDDGYAIVELFGEWNDLFDNDYKLLCENCLTYLLDNGITQFILICENVFNIYLDADDYYDAMQEELGDGWIALLRPRQAVLEELTEYRILPYFFHSPILDEIAWRKQQPSQLYRLVAARLQYLLP